MAGVVDAVIFSDDVIFAEDVRFPLCNISGVESAANDGLFSTPDVCVSGSGVGAAAYPKFVVGEEVKDDVEAPVVF